MAGVAMSTSVATARPVPFARLTSVWQTTPCSVAASCARTWPCWCGGNTSMTRSMVCGGILRVQGGEDEVAGLGRGQRDRDGLEVAQLADQDDVGVLPQHVLERVGEAVRVRADLALVDQRLLVAVQELDRVLDRHDVVGPRAVDQVDERGERRRLARTGRAGDEHETARAAARSVPTASGTPSCSSCLISVGMRRNAAPMAPRCW